MHFVAFLWALVKATHVKGLAAGIASDTDSTSPLEDVGDDHGVKIGTISDPVVVLHLLNTAFRCIP